MEALHQAHVLMQVGRNFVAGHNQEKERARHGFKHQLLKRQKPDETLVPISTFLRLEFQDGKRRAVSQSYHGSGRTHSHQLTFVGREDRAADLEALQLDRCVSATLQQSTETLRAYVVASQTDQKAQTPFAVEPGASQCVGGQYSFFHSDEDHREGVRGFFPALLEVTKCHQDVQVETGGQQNYAAYTAKYAPKFSDAFHEELLNDDADGNSVAASILSRYHPCVPEMVLQLCGQRFHQSYISTDSGGTRDFVVPALDAESFPKEIHLYQSCSWRSPEMSLLEFLRKTNDSGEISGWLKAKWEESEKDQSLPAYANQYVMQGEKVVACSFNSRLKDKFYGQWLLVNVPFQNVEELWKEDVTAQVPPTDQCLALCLTCEHPKARAMWHDPSAIEEDMQVEGRTQVYRKMVLDHVFSQKSLIDQYLAGSLPLPPAATQPAEPGPCKEISLPIQKRYLKYIRDNSKSVEGRILKGKAATVSVGDILYFSDIARQVEAVEYHDSFADMLEAVGFENAIPDAHNFEEALQVYHSFTNYENLAETYGVVAFWLREVTEASAAAVRREEPPQEWNLEQSLWLARMNADLGRAIAAHNAATEGDLDAAREEAFTKNKFQVLDGPPGTGKTSVAIEAVRRAMAQGVKVLWVVFTAQLAARMKEKLPQGTVVDTCHAAFGFDTELSECGYNLAAYGMVIVDEFSQLEARQLHHMDHLRGNVSNCVAFGLVGDPFQCAGFGAERVWYSPLWKRATVQTHLHQIYRCKDPEFQKVLSCLRTAQPTSTGKGGTLTVQKIMKGRRAWKGHTPSHSDVARLLQQHPDTTFMAITRKGTALLAQLAMEVLFENQRPVATVKADVESNPSNYNQDGKLKSCKELVPWTIRCFCWHEDFLHPQCGQSARLRERHGGRRGKFRRSEQSSHRHDQDGPSCTHPSMDGPEARKPGVPPFSAWVRKHSAQNGRKRTEARRVVVGCALGAGRGIHRNVEGQLWKGFAHGWKPAPRTLYASQTLTLTQSTEVTSHSHRTAQ